MTDSGESSSKIGSWGAIEFALGYVVVGVICLVFNRASGAEWFGEYPYTGAVFILFFVNLPIAIFAHSPLTKLVRAGVPAILILLFYSAAEDLGGIIESLQPRLELPHLILVFAATLAADFFTREKVAEVVVEVEPEEEEEYFEPEPEPVADPFDRIVGQQHIIDPLKEIARLASSGIRVGKREAPHAVLLFLGPTGVGKTEAARALSESVYGTKDALIRFDMGQFTDSSQANRFYGPPPGYVGSKEGGQLTQTVLRQPNSVVLLDEMEKAHTQIWDAFLPVFDEGYIVDGSTNQKVDMTNTIIVLTSNLLADEEGVRELSPFELKERVAAAGSLRPELLGRINEILLFNPLSNEAIAQILRSRLDQALWGLSEQGITLMVEEEQIKDLVSQVKAAKFGVRQIDDVVRSYLRKAIAEERGV